LSSTVVTYLPEFIILSLHDALPILKEHFTGSTEIVSGEIAEDFSYYFYTSEQVPSIVALGVLVNPDNTIKAAGGFIIQVMPGASEETMDFLDRRAGERTPVSTLIDHGLAPSEVIDKGTRSDNWQKIDEIHRESE